MESNVQEEYDSDLEIIDDRLLQETFSENQYGLLVFLANCDRKIPSAWNDFKALVGDVAGGIVNEKIIRATWERLVQAKFQQSTISPVVEISDDDDTVSITSSFSGKSHKQDTKIYKRKRRSLPVETSEEKAEKLREELLLDNLIELELPGILQSFGIPFTSKQLKSWCCAPRRKTTRRRRKTFS